MLVQFKITQYNMHILINNISDLNFALLKEQYEPGWPLLKTGPRSWNRNLKNLDSFKTLDLGPDPSLEKLGRTWTQKNLDREKHGLNMTLKNISDFKELYFTKIIRNMICCVKVFFEY